MIIVLASEGGFQDFTLGSTEWFWLWFSAATAILALLVGWSLMRGVLAADEGTREDEGDRPRHPGGGHGLPPAPVPHHRHHHRPAGGAGLPDLHRDPQARRLDRPVLRRVGPVPHPGLHRRLLHVRPHRLHRDGPGRAGQRAHRGRGQGGLPARRPQGRLPHRRRGRHVHRRPGPAGRHRDHHALPEHGLRHPDRLRLRRVAAGPVHAGGRRHLHQGGRRGRRPGGQGRGRHPRGRPPQRGHHRRQRGRQRR